MDIQYDIIQNHKQKIYYCSRHQSYTQMCDAKVT